MAKTAHPTPSMTAGEVSAPSSPNLLAERRSHSNGHGSPARLASAGKTTPANTEKKPQLNGHPSPLHPPAGTGNLPGTPYAEGSTKTDDRMRLAKERREERERSLAAREQVIREKERRAQLQYERTVEERWRRLDEQRQKEELRRAAVEEKRRQQLEDDKERLEALMKRSLERSLQLEQRARRWTRGPGAAGAGDSQHAPPPLCAASSAFPHGIASPLPASSESAPCSPHRSPYRGTLNPADHNRTGLHGGSQSTPNTPKKERLRRERRTASPACGSSPARRAGSPAGGSKYFTSASPSTPKLASKIRPQSPCALGGYRSSPPARRRPVPSADDTSGGGRGDVDRVDGQREGSKVKSCVKRRSNIHRPDSPSPTEKSAEKEHVVNVETGRNTSTEILDKGSPTGKAVAGTTNAEEASRLLAERRRQARVQKEMEEKKQQQEKEERLKAEQLKVNLSREHQRQEQVQENVREDPHRAKDGDGEQRREGKEKERESQTERETEKGKAPAEEDTERQRQDRELQKLQEEEERQVRKKRIEEIMKRTRKGDADFKEGQTEARSVSLPGELRMNVQTSELVSERAVQNAFQVDERVAAQGFEKEDAPKKEVKREVVEQRDVLRCAQLKNGTQQKTSSPQESGVEKGAQVAKISRNDNIVELQETPAGMQVNKRDGVPETSLAKCVDAGSNPPDGVVMNGQRRNQNGQPHAEAGRQKSLRVPGRPEPVAGGASPAPPSAERPSVPVVKLELLDVKGSSSVDEVQSMDISPASKEELISIPKFPPVNDVRLNSVSGGRALEDLLDLTGGVACPKTPGSESNADDCNKNLIGGVVSPILDSSHPYVFSVRK